MPRKTVRIAVASVLAAIGVGALVAIATAAGRGNASVAEYQYPAGTAGPKGGPSTGKITICHNTHSATKPWVRITISLNAWPAHARHGDSQDLSHCGGALSSSKNNGKPGKGNPQNGNKPQTPGNSQGHGHNKP